MLLIFLMTILLGNKAQANCQEHFDNHKRALKEAEALGGPGAAIAAGTISVLCPPCLVHAISAAIVTAAIAEQHADYADRELERYHRCLAELSVEERRKIEQQQREDEERMKKEVEEMLKQVQANGGVKSLAHNIGHALRNR